MPTTPPALNAHETAVAEALALLWENGTRSRIVAVLRLLNYRVPTGNVMTASDIELALITLLNKGLAHSKEGSKALQYGLNEPLRTQLYSKLLDHFPLTTLQQALYKACNFQTQTYSYAWPVREQSATIAIVRLAFFDPNGEEFLARWVPKINNLLDYNQIYQTAILDSAFDAPLFCRIPPQLRWEIAYQAALMLSAYWQHQHVDLVHWAIAETITHPEEKPEHLRLQLAHCALLMGDGNTVQQLLSNTTSASADALRTALAIQKGEWALGQQGFEVALKKRHEEIGGKKKLFPKILASFYPLTLLAQGSPKQIEQARKFCIGESGSRTPEYWTDWGKWVHACDIRLGNLAPEKSAFSLKTTATPSYSNLWALMLRAWLIAELPLSDDKDHNTHQEAVVLLKRPLKACGLLWLEAQVDAADRVIRGERSDTPFFAGGGEEAWRSVLNSLLALAGQSSPSATVQSGETRLIWQLSLGKHDNLESIDPFEQKRGPRGWSKAKPVTLSKLATNKTLAPHDARVAQCIVPDRMSQRKYMLEMSSAIMTLIGHPHVVLDNAPEIMVDVVEGTAQLETVRQTTADGERFVLRVSPAPHPVEVDRAAHFLHYQTEIEQRDNETLRYIHVHQDSPQRVRVTRLTPAQRRAAQLVSGSFAVPVSAQNELQDALRALAGHFNVHSDEAAAAAKQVPAASGLRAELSPAGDGLLLRLVVAPLGEQGPRLMPGHGRTRVLAAIHGESIGTERDLAAEQAHLDSVLAKLDFLNPPLPSDTVCEWTVEDPELALALVETLPQLPAVAALDWPRGKAVRVTPVDLKQLQITVKSERDWFRIDGRAALDEGRVFELQQLLAAAASASRFVALGEGQYLALSKALRERLQALAAVAEGDKNGLKTPALAAPWLDETLDGAVVDFDKRFKERIQTLRTAQAQTHPLPGTLQASLRNYQEDGYVWAQRLAAAGFGACLADDMGLGKTLQALAVLLARAAGGPALVVAPTSVCGNWLAETTRFAPSLNARIYGEVDGERKTLIDAAGPGDLVIVSYTLMQQAGADFAARTWHTLVADEAQAVKNATAKRSQALFDLPADFRLALSGTPVENRLAELWSIMRFCNPGLLGTLNRFNERFANPIERSRDREAQRLLRRLVAPFVLRRTKTQVLDDLPPRTELVLSVVPDADEAAHYEALRRNLISEAEVLAGAPTGQARLHILAQLTKLRRAACDPRLVTPDLGYVGAKVRAFAELAQELAANGHKALVFSQFVDFLTLLRAPLDEAGIAYQYLDGSTPPAERTKRVAAFQSGSGDLFLISLKAGGFGLNLTAADYVVITDPWWNPAAEDQAMGRAHRIGQQRPVTVYRLVGKGTLEERIIELHHDKRALAEGVLAEGEDGAALPSTEELIALMRG